MGHKESEEVDLVGLRFENVVDMTIHHSEFGKIWCLGHKGSEEVDLVGFRFENVLGVATNCVFGQFGGSGCKEPEGIDLVGLRFKNVGGVASIVSCVREDLVFGAQGTRGS